MIAAVDVSSQSLRSLRRENGSLLARRCRPAYGVIARRPEVIDLLREEGLPFAVCDDALILLGDAAVAAAETFHGACREIVSGGQLPESNPIARQALGTLVEALLPPASTGDVCCLIRSGMRPNQRSQDIDPLNAGQFIEQLLRLRGWTTVAMSRAFAAVLPASLATNGLHAGLDLNAHRCELSVVESGRERLRLSTATTSSLPLEILAKSGSERGEAHSDAKSERLVQSVIQPALEILADHLDRERRRLSIDGPLTMGLAGSLIEQPNIPALIATELHSMRFPLPILSVQLPAGGEFACALGGLEFAARQPAVTRQGGPRRKAA
jgi:hypothetical protein